jgi:hypothetical protein
MSDLRKSAQMALNHLLSFDPMVWSPKTAEQVYAAITELRTGLAQPEPVAALDEEKRRENILRRLNVLEATNVSIDETLVAYHEHILRLTRINEYVIARIKAL